MIVLGPDGRAANLFFRRDAFDVVFKQLAALNVGRADRNVTLYGPDDKPLYNPPATQTGDTVRIRKPARYRE